MTPIALSYSGSTCMSLPWLKDERGIVCLRPLTCSRVDNSYLVQHRSKLYCAKTFVPDKNSSWVQCTSNKQACVRKNLLYFCQTRLLYWQWNLHKVDTQRTLSSIYLKEECARPLFPEWLVGSWKVHLTIESVDNILRPNHSNQWNLFWQYSQILTLGIFQSKKFSTVEPLSYDHLFYTATSLLRPYIFLTQTQKSPRHFIILKTMLMQSPHY